MNKRRLGLSLIPAVGGFIASVPWCTTFYLTAVNTIDNSIFMLAPALAFMFYGLFCCIGELGESDIRLTMHYVVKTVLLYENFLYSVSFISIMTGIIFIWSYAFMIGASVIFILAGILELIFLYSIRIVVNINIMIECRKKRSLVRRKSKSMSRINGKNIYGKVKQA